MQVRFFSVHNDDLRGTHLHLCWTAYTRTMADAIKQMKERVATNAVSRAPLFFDRGTGDSDLIRLDSIPQWNEA
jgi:hypothetical protein